MVTLLLCFAGIFVAGIDAFNYWPRSSPFSRKVGTVLFNSKEEQRDAQWKLQQDILRQRKNKSKMKEYFETVEKKRQQLSQEAKSTIWAKSKDAVDPLEKWKEAKSDGITVFYYFICNRLLLYCVIYI